MKILHTEHNVVIRYIRNLLPAASFLETDGTIHRVRMLRCVTDKQVHDLRRLHEQGFHENPLPLVILPRTKTQKEAGSRGISF